jgi:hypothetical protein
MIIDLKLSYLFKNWERSLKEFVQKIKIICLKIWILQSFLQRNAWKAGLGGEGGRYKMV